MIDLAGNCEFDAPRELLWEMILDPEVLARVMPGCDKLTIVNEHEYQGQMKLKIGPVDGVFRGTVALSDLRPPEGFHFIVNGRGPSGIVEGEGDVRLEETQAGTGFHYTGAGQISGRMATVGQRLMTSSAKAIVKQSLDNLDKQVQARIKPEPVSKPSEIEQQTDVPGPEAVPPAPSQSDFLLGVAENMIEELVPDPRQRKLLVGLAFITVITIFLNWYANFIARRVIAKLDDNQET